MKIKANDRVLIAGKTGSGKTWLARALLADVPRLVVIDPKSNLTTWGLKEPGGFDWFQFERGKPGRFRIVPPIDDNIPEWFEELCKRLYSIGNFILYIDEVYAVVTPGSRPGKWLTALYTRGRELGIGVWAATQRPAFIPMFLISEADWLITFRLNVPDDRQRLAAMAGGQLLRKIPDEHGFWMYQVGAEDALYYKTSVLKPRTGV